MAKNIRVLLLEDIAGVGHAGEVVVVKEGYARNSLFASGKAALADAAVMTRHAVQKAQAAKKLQAELATLQTRAEQLSGTEIVINARRKEGDEIFGRITAKTIADALKDQTGVDCKAKDVVLPEPITTIGSTTVTLHLSPEVETSIRLTVMAPVATKQDTHE